MARNGRRFSWASTARSEESDGAAQPRAHRSVSYFALAMIEEDYGLYTPPGRWPSWSSLRLRLTRGAFLPPGVARTTSPQIVSPTSVGRAQSDSALSVETRAPRLHLPSHFSKASKSVFGQPPTEFVETLRLNEARRRLSKRQKTPAKRRALRGFHQHGYFSAPLRTALRPAPRLLARTPHRSCDARSRGPE